MQIGISSYSFSAWQRATGADYATLCQKAKEIGFTAIEFTDIDPALAGAKTEQQAALHIKEVCGELGLSILAYTVGANFMQDPEEGYAHVCRKLDVAATLGAPLLRHDASFALKDLSRYTWEDGIRDMAPAIRRCADYAQSLGIRTMTENHGFIYQDPERVLALIQAVDHEYFGWLFDIGNFSVVDRNATEALPLAMPYIFHVHAKDMILKPGDILPPAGFNRSRGGNFWRGTALGHGQIPVAKTLIALKNAGYSGAVSLEFEGPEDCLSSLSWGLEYLKKLEL